MTRCDALLVLLGSLFKIVKGPARVLSSVLVTPEATLHKIRVNT